MDNNRKLKVIRQGDQYVIPITVAMEDGTIITPDICEGMRIMVGSYTAFYPDGKLEFDTEAEKWLFPLTQEMSYGMRSGGIVARAQFKVGGSIITTKGCEIYIEDTAFRKEW